MPALNSSAIRFADYDPETQTLRLSFTGGGSYTFEGVPQDVYDALLASPSPGRYYAQSIKGQYG